MKKKLILVIIFCLSILQIFSQDLSKAIADYNAGNYQTAALEFEKVLPLIEEQVGSNDTVYFTKIILLTAFCYQNILDNENAEKYLLKGISIFKYLGNESQNNGYLGYIVSLAKLYKDIGNYTKALPLYIEQKDIIEQKYGNNKPEFASACVKLADLYLKTGNYEKAELLYIHAKTIREKTLGKNHIDYAISCNYLAFLYYKMEKFNEAETFYIEAKSIFDNYLGENYTEYGIICYNLGLLNLKKSNFKKAESFFIKAKKIYEKISGKDNANYASACMSIAGLYQDLGNYKKAEPLYIEAKKIYVKVLGKNSSEYSTVCNNLASFYQETGKYYKAEQLFIEAKNLKKNNNGINSQEYATAIDNLAGLYLQTGKYANAEKLFVEAKKLRKTIFGENSKEFAFSCNNLAEFYMQVGNYDKVEPLIIEAKNIFKKELGEYNIYYATTCGNLAHFYYKKKNYNKAELLNIETKKIYEKIYGNKHPAYADICLNLGALYESTGNFKKALQLYIEAKNIYEKTYGKEHINYATSCNNIAGVYMSLKQYDKAELFYIEAKNITQKILGKYHPDYAERCSNLAILYQTTKEYKKAEPLFIELNNIVKNNIYKSGEFMSIKEREYFLENKIYVFFNILNLFYLSQNKENKAYAGYSYNNALLLKGLLLRSTIVMKKAVQSSNNQNLKLLYQQWFKNGQLFIKQQNLPNNKRVVDLDSLSEVINVQEKELFASEEFKNQQNLQNLSWQNIQKSLKNDEAAIEFISYKIKENNDTVIYCALVLTKEMEYPEMIYLGLEKELDSIISKRNSKISDYEYIKNLYDKSSIKSKKLYNIIWKPIEPYLKDKKKIFISPSGILNRISFKAIYNSNNQMLSDIYQIRYLTSTSKILLNPNLYIKDLKKLVLYGDIDYSPDTIAWKKNTTKYHSFNDSIVSRSLELNNLIGKNRYLNISWSHLNGSKVEVDKIDSLLNKIPIDIDKYTGLNASEEVFKNYIYNFPTAIHIATHGFYFPKEGTEGNIYLKGMDRIKQKYSLNPLERSGIVLAGANWTWGNNNLLTNIEDGILTANEISQLDMFNVKLVTLSACQTGLGDVVGSEGVFGLQRALKMAGVDFMIISLWKVPDKQTQEMMTKFYAYLLAGDDIYSAFDNAQTDLKNQYRNFKGGMYAWAAFVLVY